MVNFLRNQMLTKKEPCGKQEAFGIWFLSLLLFMPFVVASWQSGLFVLENVPPSHAGYLGFDSFWYLNSTNGALFNTRHPLLKFLINEPLQRLLIPLLGRQTAFLCYSFLMAVITAWAHLLLYKILRNRLYLSTSSAFPTTLLMMTTFTSLILSFTTESFQISMALLLAVLYLQMGWIQNGVAYHAQKWGTTALYSLALWGITVTNFIKPLTIYLLPNSGVSIGRRMRYGIMSTIAVAVLGGVYFVPSYLSNKRYFQTLVQQKEATEAPSQPTATIPETARTPYLSAEDAQFIKKNHWLTPRFSQWVEPYTFAQLAGGFWGQSILVSQVLTAADHWELWIVMDPPPYQTPLPRIYIALLAGLTLLGLLAGRRNPLVALLLGYLSVDILIHVVCGWGMREPHLYGGHWIFLIPIAIGSLLQWLQNRPAWIHAKQLLIIFLYLAACYQMGHNGAELWHMFLAL